MEKQSLRTRKDEEGLTKMVSQEQVANGELLLVDPSGKEYLISDYTQDLGLDRERAIVDKYLLLKLAHSLKTADFSTIIRLFKNSLINVNNMEDYIKILEDELVFQKFVRDIDAEKKSSKDDQDTNIVGSGCGGSDKDLPY